MAFGIIATPGAANANSYVTEAEAVDYIAQMVSNADVQHWNSGNDDSRHRALASATQRLDRERFLGARATDTQALQWPRTGVRKPDTYINTYAVGFPFRITTDYFTILRSLIRSNRLRRFWLSTCTTTKMALVSVALRITSPSASAA